MKRFLWTSALLALVLAVNVFCRKQLPFAYSRVMACNQLYYPAERLRISDLRTLPGDSVAIAFKGKGIGGDNLFELYEGDRLLASRRGALLSVRPDTGRRQYRLRINGSADSYRLNIDYTPIAAYRQYGNSSNTMYEVNSPDLPVTNLPLYPLSYWQVPVDESAAATDKAQSWLHDSMQLRPGDAPAAVVAKIGGWICKVTRGRAGTPADSLFRMSPMDQLEYVRSGRSALWCGNYSDIFSFFAARAGIPVRALSCGGAINGVDIGSHAFNEVWLADKNTWAYVDLTAQNVFIQKGDQYLDAVDVQRYLRYPGGDSGLTALHFNGDSLVATPYAQADSLARYYFHPGNYFYFFCGDFLKIKEPESKLDRAVKFFYTRPYYAVYSDNLPGGNLQFYARLFTNYLLALLFVLWLLALLRWGRRRRAQ